jgi:ParB family chromosome partitioning protein
MARASSRLEEIDPDKIDRNPDNPRLIFREEQMTELLESIQEVGIRVPLSVFQKNGRYALIDGERRWRCAKKLNLKIVPAHVQPKPSRLENLLMMFNIHNVRVDWDLMPMALKLREIRDMLDKEGKPTDPKALAAITGVRLATVKRAFDLLDLPQRYQRLLMREAEKPRREQRVTADLFIEVYKSLHAVERYVPEIFEEVSKVEYVDSMVKKYLNRVVENVVAFREISKIARAELAGIDRSEAQPAILRLVTNKTYSISEAFQDTVQAAYERRDLLTKLRGILETLTHSRPISVDSETREILVQVRSEIDRLIA